MNDQLTIPDEVKQAFEKVDPSKGLFEFHLKRDSWDTLFNYYNENNEKKLGQGCRPCFPKVYYWIKQQQK